MRPLPFLAVFVAGCALASNGLETRDAGGAGAQAGGWSADAGAGSGGSGVDAAGNDPVAADAGSVDAGPDAPPLDPGDSSSDDGAAPDVIERDAEAPTYTLDVPATEGFGCASWFDTGLDLAPDQNVTLVATGTWRYGFGPAFECGPDGNAAGATAGTGFPLGALMGNIGGGAPFVVGARFQAKAKTPGRLQLGVNDTLCTDNSGTLHVVVTLDH